MARPRPLILSISLLVVCTVASAETSVKDPQAVSILAQCLSAAGGVQAVGAVQDFTATGNVIYNWAEQSVSGTATLRGLGPIDFRIDATLPAGTRSWSVTGRQGALRETDGTLSPIPPANAENWGSLSFPYPAMFAALNDPSVSVLYLGLVTINGQQAHQVRIQGFSAVQPQPVVALVAPLKDFFIDPTTFLPVATQDTAVR